MPNPLRMGGKLVGDTWVNTSDCEDFIEAGCAKFQASDYQSAITFFEKALTAEGAGTKRDRTKPAELTMGEKQSAYYNLTACHAKMENWDLAFASLELTFQSGYANGRLYGLGRAARDYELLEQDLDFENLRKDERWNTILTKYRVKGSELAFQLDPSNSSVGGTHVEAKEEYVIGVLLKQRLRVVVAYLYSSSSSSFHFLSFPL